MPDSKRLESVRRLKEAGDDQDCTMLGDLNDPRSSNLSLGRTLAGLRVASGWRKSEGCKECNDCLEACMKW